MHSMNIGRGCFGFSALEGNGWNKGDGHIRIKPGSPCLAVSLEMDCSFNCVLYEMIRGLVGARHTSSAPSFQTQCQRYEVIRETSAL